MVSGRRTICDTCYNIDQRPLKDVLYQGPNRYRGVRDHARKIYKKDILNGCERCGYKTHVEIAHRKAISDFPLDTIISEINKRENIGIWCRNCHWEFDHGLFE